VLALVGTINIPIIKYSVDWWLTLHQGASFRLTEAPTMPPEMWLPLAVNVVGIYCLFGANLVSRMRAEIIHREQGTQWVRDLAALRGAGGAASEGRRELLQHQ
jgi:heme exporter protein C